MNPRGYIEPCLGAGAVLLALLDPSLVPAHGYMGGKRKLARPILRHGFGLQPGDGAREVVIAEAGPLGWVWSELLSERKAGAVVDALLVHRDRDPIDLFWEQATKPPTEDATERAAQVLILAGWSASTLPFWWNGTRWCIDGRNRNPLTGRWTGAREKLICRVGAAYRRDLVRFTAKRLLPIARTLSRLPVRFIHGDYADAIPAGDLSGWDVYLDPPYAGATSYAVDLPRARVLRDAQDLRARGATVAVSEAVALDLRRWRAVDLTRPGGKPEWLTCSRWPRAAQVGLFEARA